jgi:hypothetical protein
VQKEKEKNNTEMLNATELSPIQEWPSEVDMAFEAQNEQNKEPSCDDKTAESLFRKLLRKFQNVRNVSSPVLKLITIHRLMNEVMAAFNDSQN